MGPYDWWWHGMPFMWIFPFLFVIALVFCVLMMTGGFRRWGMREGTGGGRASARDILDERYARGDLTREQYEEMRQVLRP